MAGCISKKKAEWYDVQEEGAADLSRPNPISSESERKQATIAEFLSGHILSTPEEVLAKLKLTELEASSSKVPEPGFNQPEAEWLIRLAEIPGCEFERWQSNQLLESATQCLKDSAHFISRQEGVWVDSLLFMTDFHSKIKKAIDDIEELCRLSYIKELERLELERLKLMVHDSRTEATLQKRIDVLQDQKLKIAAEHDKLKSRIEELMKDDKNQVPGETSEGDQAKLATQRLQEELAMLKDQCICRLCMIVCRDTLILPCLDFLYCNNCILDLIQLGDGKCPRCKIQIRTYLNCNIKDSPDPRMITPL